MTRIVTPPGQFVQGDMFTPQTKNMTGQPLVTKTGEPAVKYFFAIAIAKTDPGYAAMYAQIQQVAQAGFPGGHSTLPHFAWKIVDGDDPKNAGKEGFAGHWILRCSNGFPFKSYVRNGGDFQEIINPDELKRGAYIVAAIDVSANGDLNKPGLYLNPVMVERIGFGPEIVSGPDASEVLGATQVVLPAGASATPVGVVAPVGVVQPPVAVVAPPVAVVAPPVAVVAPPVAVVAPIKTMTAKAGGATYEQMVAAGWDDVKMIAEGYLINTAVGVVADPTILNG